jgi:thiamine monophosphate kinase
LEADPADLLEPGAARLSNNLGLPPLAFLAAHHGEFELVFSVPTERLEALETASAAIGWSPIRIGTVATGSGVQLGGRTLDTARIRNLLHDVGGDLRAYVAQLLAITGVEP